MAVCLSSFLLLLLLLSTEESGKIVGLLEVRIQVRPTQAIQLIRPSVWMLDSMHPTIAATATKTAVQVPCVETALRPMEILRMPEPATKIQSAITYQQS